MPSDPSSRLIRFKESLAHAFAVESLETEIQAEEMVVAKKVATFLVRRRLTAPAIMLLETGRPLNFIGSQFLTFLSPFVSIIFTGADNFNQFTRFLEKRKSIDCLIDQIVAQEDQNYE